MENPYALTRLIVGADAHIGPAKYADFTVICGEFVTSQEADVGIGPYEQVGNCIRIRLRFPLKQLSSAGRSRAPPLPTLFEFWPLSA